MDNIIDNSVFVGELLIPNATVPNSPVGIVVKNCIATYQESFLVRLLGIDLYEDFKAWYEAATLNTDSRWNNILNGKSFKPSSYCPSVQWLGLKYVIARFVYYSYRRDVASQTVDGGEVVTDHQNATNVLSVRKMTNAWNQMVHQVRILKEYMDYADSFKDDPMWIAQRSYGLEKDLFHTQNIYGI